MPAWKTKANQKIKMRLYKFDILESIITHG